MAIEITGLAVGTVALIRTFEDYTDIFGMIVSGPSLTDATELFNTKLDFEMMLLLQWADQVRLTESRYHNPRLDDPDLNRTIARVLGNIKEIIERWKGTQRLLWPCRLRSTRK